MPVSVKPMIAEAFGRLAREKSVDKITVKDLVEACGISRQTFYYHFQDILEVIEWSAGQAFDALLQRSLQEEDPQTVLYEFLTASEETGALLQKLLHSQRREQVEGILLRAVQTYLRELMRCRGAAAGLPYEDAEVVLRFCSYGVTGFLIEACDQKPGDRRRLAEQMHRLLKSRMEPQPAAL